jgi:hypothetical protein
MKLVKIITHHENSSRAVELYLHKGLIAIGYVYNEAVSMKNEEAIREYFRKDRSRKERSFVCRRSFVLLTI